MKKTPRKVISPKKDFFISLAFSLGIIALLFVFRIYWFEGVRIIYFFLGLLNFTFFSSLFFFLIEWSIKKIGSKKWKEKILEKNILPLFFLFASLFFTVFASYNFSKIHIEEYTIESSKVTKEYTFIQINDIQYGSVPLSYMKKVVHLVRDQDPDFVVFVGDLVDFEGYTQEDFEILSELETPLFFERGNHEFYHFPEQILSHLQKVSNVRLLINAKDSFEEIDIVGIDHTTDQKEYEKNISEIKLDSERFSILLYHEPRHVKYSVDLEYDLLLYGHTHAGQIWPFTWVVDFMHTYSDGFFTLKESHIHTSDGVSLWGPLMRLGSQNEIVSFTIKPHIENL